jgi:hypothetical protein
MTIEQQNTRQEEERLARQILAGLSLPPEIERVEIELKDDSSGTPALFLSFVVTPDSKLTPESTPRLSRFMFDVAKEFLRSGIPRFPYVSLDQAA